MVVKVFLATTNRKSAIIFTPVMQELMWLQFLLMVPFRLVLAYAPISIREIFTQITFTISGKINLTLFATEAGQELANVKTADVIPTVRVADFTIGMATNKMFWFVITKELNEREIA